MAEFDINNATVEVKCPNCGKAIKKTLKWFQSSSAKCPGCDAKFEASQLSKVTKDVNKQVADFKKSLGKLGR